MPAWLRCWHVTNVQRLVSLVFLLPGVVWHAVWQHLGPLACGVPELLNGCTKWFVDLALVMYLPLNGLQPTRMYGLHLWSCKFRAAGRLALLLASGMWCRRTPTAWWCQLHYISILRVQGGGRIGESQPHIAGVAFTNRMQGLQVGMPHVPPRS